MGLYDSVANKASDLVSRLDPAPAVSGAINSLGDSALNAGVGAAKTIGSIGSGIVSKAGDALGYVGSHALGHGADNLGRVGSAALGVAGDIGSGLYNYVSNGVSNFFKTDPNKIDADELKKAKELIARHEAAEKKTVSDVKAKEEQKEKDRVAAIAELKAYEKKFGGNIVRSMDSTDVKNVRDGLVSAPQVVTNKEKETFNEFKKNYKPEQFSKAMGTVANKKDQKTTG